MERSQHTPNKALAQFFARSNADYDDYYPGYRKRFMLRKRGKNGILTLKKLLQK
jgi:hypothetical protein